MNLPVHLLYSQLLKEILISIEYDKHAKRQFIDYLITL